MTDILGLDPLSEQWSDDAGADDAAHRALSELVDSMLEQRQKARAERDFGTADLLRDRLLASGIAVEDTPDGPQWTLKDD
jgi:cysteinyl-tRNA synthetase